LARPIDLPEGARFSCQSCGRCCQGWRIPVDQTTVDRLRAHDWGADPFEPARAPGEPYRIKLVRGRCFFLDQENRCRIHTELSYEAKPAVCRAFPLTVLEVAGQRYARLSFWCPTVTANSGKPLTHQSRWLNETAKHADRRKAPLLINETTEIAPRDFERVHHVLRRFLLETSLPVSDRLAAAAALIRRLDSAAENADKKNTAASVDGIVRSAELDGAAALAQETRRRGRPSDGRQVLSLYVLQDSRDGRFAAVAHFLSVLMFNLGIGRLRLHAVPARASWRQLRRVVFVPSAVSADLLTRYFCSKLDSRRYVAGEATLVTGVNTLVAAYGMINLLARMKAASDGRVACDVADVQSAVSAADLLVVEHHGPDRGRVHVRLTQVALGNPDLCADLLACLDAGQ